MTVSDILKNGAKEYVAKLKKDPFYRLTANVEEASAEESEEILAEIDSLSDDDLTIASTKRIKVQGSPLFESFYKSVERGLPILGHDRRLAQ